MVLFAKTISRFNDKILCFRQNCVIIKLNITKDGVMPMQASYDKLWKMLIDKKMNRTELRELSGISSNVIAKMGRNEFVSMDSLAKICVALQ